MRYVVPLALTLLTLAGCAASTPSPVVRPAPVVAPPRPAPAPQPLASDWNDWPFTPGAWRYDRQATFSQASFQTDADVISLSCDQASRRIELLGILATPVTIRTTTMTRTLSPTGNFKSDQPVMGVALAPTDALLDAMAFSRGRIVIEQTGRAPAVLPPHAEIGRVIEDCRG